MSGSGGKQKKKITETALLDCWAGGCNSVVQCLPSMHQVLGSILSITKKEKEEKTEIALVAYICGGEDIK